MKRIEENGLVYYRFDIFEPFPEMVHGVFTRRGGVSPPPCDSLNLAFSTDDSVENVRANLDLAAGALGFDRVAFVGQVHGDQALVVRKDDGYGPRQPGDVKVGYDALVTSDHGVGLLTKLADCQGVVLYDPETRSLAVVHSGWRGSVVNVLGRTVKRLASEFDVRPADLRAGISPSLGPCCGEFVNFRQELPEEFWEFGQENHFDFWAISRRQLIEAGLLEGRIETAGICTKCGSREFYSYRGEKSTGRFGVMAGLKALEGA